MSFFWAIFWVACVVLASVAGLRVRRSIRSRYRRPSPPVDDDAVRRIIEEGVLESVEDEPLDLTEIEAEERRFWEQTWDEADEW